MCTAMMNTLGTGYMWNNKGQMMEPVRKENMKEADLERTWIGKRKIKGPRASEPRGWYT